MTTKSQNLPHEDDQDLEASEETKKEAPAFPTSLNSPEAYEYAKFHVEDKEELQKNLKKLDKACEEGADESVIAQLVCAVDTSIIMRFIRKNWDKGGKKVQYGLEKVLTPLPLQGLNIGPVQIAEKIGFVQSKKHIVPGDEAKTEENIRKAGGFTRLAAEHGLKLGAYAAKLSDHPKLKFFALAEPFIEPAARALDSLEKGAENLRRIVLKNRAEWEKEQARISGITEDTHKQVTSQVSNLRSLPKRPKVTDEDMPIAA